MSSFDIGVSTPLFGFKLSKKYTTTLKKGESIIIKQWKWRRFGWVQKLVTNEDGIVKVTVL